MAQKRLTPTQHKAAEMIGRGHPPADVAKEAKVSRRTVLRWGERDDFKAVVRKAQRSVVVENPSVQAVLEDALTATKANGEPDHRIRVMAARALNGADGPVNTAAPPREVTFNEENLD